MPPELEQTNSPQLGHSPGTLSFITVQPGGGAGQADSGQSVQLYKVDDGVLLLVVISHFWNDLQHFDPHGFKQPEVFEINVHLY